MAKLFHQTASALQKISPELGEGATDLGPILGHKRPLENGPQTRGQCAKSESRADADPSLGSPNLQKLTSLESLAFHNLMSADGEVRTSQAKALS